MCKINTENTVYRYQRLGYVDPDLGLQTQTKVDPNPGSRHGQKSYKKLKKNKEKKLTEPVFFY